MKKQLALLVFLLTPAFFLASCEKVSNKYPDLNSYQTGKNGVSITGISKTSSEGNVDTYTISYSDGTTSTFTVTNGTDGKTPAITINDDGYWCVDGVSTGVKAQGTNGSDGSAGATGNGISNISYSYDESGNTKVTMTMTDGTSQNILVQKGDKGDTGKTAYSNTILPTTGGTISLNKGSATVGEEITFYFTPSTDYTFNSFKLNDTEYNASSATLVGSTYQYSTTMVENGFVVSAAFYANVTSNASDLLTSSTLSMPVATNTNQTVVVDDNIEVQSISSSISNGNLAVSGSVDQDGTPLKTLTIADAVVNRNALAAQSLSVDDYGIFMDLEETNIERTITFKDINIKLDRDGLASLVMMANDNRSNDNTKLVFDNVNFILSTNITSTTTRLLQAQWIKNVTFNKVKAYSDSDITSWFYNMIELTGSNLEQLNITDSSFTGKYAKAIYIERTSKDGVINVNNCTFTNNATAYNGTFTFGNAGYDTTTYDNPMVLNITNTNLNMNLYNSMYILGQLNAWGDSCNPYVKINFNSSTINSASINVTDDIYVAIYTSGRSADNPFVFPGFYVDGVKAIVEY